MMSCILYLKFEQSKIRVLLALVAGVATLFLTSTCPGDVIEGPFPVAGSQVYNWMNGSVTAGPEFTLTEAFDSDDLVTITASGIVDFVAGGGADNNAAGISLEVADAGVPNSVVDSVSGRALSAGGLAVWNPTFGAFSLFELNSSVGLGALTPPTNLNQTRTVGEIFGAVSLLPGDSWRLLVVDNNTGNSGSFTVSLSFQSSSAIPEPSASLLMSVVGVGVLLRFRQNRRDAQTDGRVASRSRNGVAVRLND